MLGLEVNFSSWRQWKDRGSLPGIKCPGVYILAQFDVMPLGIAEPLDERVVYIGETCNSSLIGRWRGFDKSACTGKFGHSGGRTYYKKFQGDTTKLFVAAFSADSLGENERSPFIRYFERKLIWEYVQKWGEMPPCNLK